MTREVGRMEPNTRPRTSVSSMTGARMIVTAIMMYSLSEMSEPTVSLL